MSLASLLAKTSDYDAGNLEDFGLTKIYRDRNDAVLEFTENPNCNLMLISLKGRSFSLLFPQTFANSSLAGNAGLNLTAANHVIMLDPFWNPFVEYQAADRCYRIGQTKDVTVHRILIGPPEGEAVSEEGGYTVEDRILRLQDNKRRLVETALDESAGREVSRLGVRELGYLFGLKQPLNHVRLASGRLSACLSMSTRNILPGGHSLYTLLTTHHGANQSTTRNFTLPIL